jgi:Family of unknown function (DUF5681)
MKKRRNDYHVGYGRPPVHARFNAGQSGNPKGRPKGRRKMGEVLDAVLSERILIREGDKVRRVTKAEALVHSMYKRALSDPKAFGMLMDWCEQRGEFENVPFSKIVRVLIDPKTGQELPID